MYRFVTIMVVFALTITLPISCKKKEGGEKPQVSGAKFDESYRIALGHFKNIYEIVLTNENIGAGKDDVDKLSQQWKNIINDFASSPPARYADHDAWKIWLFDMEGIIKNLSKAVNEQKTDEAKNLCFEFMKNVINLNETTNNLTPKDEITRFEILAGEMELAMKEGKGDEMKRILVKMETTQDKLYTSTYPETAKGREAEFDRLKNELYDALNDFKFSTPEEREKKFEKVREIAHLMFLEFA